MQFICRKKEEKNSFTFHAWALIKASSNVGQALTREAHQGVLRLCYRCCSSADVALNCHAFGMLQEGLHFLCPLGAVREHPVIIRYIPVCWLLNTSLKFHVNHVMIVTQSLLPVASRWCYDYTTEYRHVDVFRAGPRIKCVKFGKDLSMYSEVTTVSCFMTNHWFEHHFFCMLCNF